ncbi:hypothetical protein LPB41_03330 [Thalassospira sp. MA62]|nr:hypothetical protein [Thalassospira sp. MA62]
MRKAITNAERPSDIEPGSINDVVVNWEPLPVAHTPGIEGMLKEHRADDVNISADGMRSNGRPVPNDVQSTILVLGSSPAWGYQIADDQTLSAHLERELANTRVENYAGLAQKLQDNMLRWHLLNENNKKPDLVIIAGASTDIGMNCHARFNRHQNTPENNNSKNLYYIMYKKFLSRDTSHNDFLCDTTENQHLAVTQSVMAVKNAINYARKQNVPFYLVYYPTPYDGYSSNENLLSDERFREELAPIQHVFSLYRSALLDLDIPELVDLAQALPTDQLFFLDKGSHLSGNGNKILATKIAERIRTDYPSLSAH